MLFLLLFLQFSKELSRVLDSPLIDPHHINGLGQQVTYFYKIGGSPRSKGIEQDKGDWNDYIIS